MKHYFLLSIFLSGFAPLVYAQQDYYIDKTQDTIYGSISKNFMTSALSFKTSDDSKTVRLRPEDFTYAKDNEKGITYISAFDEYDRNKRKRSIFASNSEGPIYIIEKSTTAYMSSNPSGGFTVPMAKSAEYWIHKEGFDVVLFFNSKGPFASANDNRILKLKSMIDDEPVTLALLEIDKNKKITVKELYELVEDYNSRKR